MWKMTSRTIEKQNQTAELICLVCSLVWSMWFQSSQGAACYWLSLFSQRSLPAAKSLQAAAPRRPKTPLTRWQPSEFHVVFMKRRTSGAADPNHDRKGALSEITNATSSRRLLSHCLFHLRGSYPAAAADGPLHVWPRPINTPTPAGCRGLNHSFPLRQVFSFFLEGNPPPEKLSRLPLTGNKAGESVRNDERKPQRM